MSVYAIQNTQTFYNIPFKITYFRSMYKLDSVSRLSVLVRLNRLLHEYFCDAQFYNKFKKGIFNKTFQVFNM